MKTLILIFFGVLAILSSYAQRYETWIGTSGISHEIHGNFAFSNDSILCVYSNPSLWNSLKDRCFKWDEVYALSIRNKTKHVNGQLLGMGVGLITSIIVNSSIKKTADDKNWGLVFVLPLVTVGLVGTGALAGHFVTCGKIIIPLNGKNKKEKNQSLETRIKTKN
jgi:hypothetical protein